MQAHRLNLVVVVAIILSTLFNAMPVVNAYATAASPQSAPRTSNGPVLDLLGLQAEAPHDVQSNNRMTPGGPGHILGVAEVARQTPTQRVGHGQGSEPSETRLAQPSQGFFLPIMYKSWQTLEQHPATPAASLAQTTQALTAGGTMFIENVGQFDPGARFKVSGGGGTLYLADDALWLIRLEHPKAPVTDTQRFDPTRNGATPKPTTGVNLKFSFVGANPHPKVEGFNRLDTHVSYFIDNDSSKWRSDVPVWGGVRYVDLYPGIDLELTSEKGQMIQRLVVRDTAQLANVRLHVDGADGVALEGVGDQAHLNLATAMGKVAFPLFQIGGTSNLNVPGPTLTGNEVGTPFVSPANAGTRTTPGLQSLPIQKPYSTLALTNTSDLGYSSFLGGSNWDTGNGIAVDASGAAYVVGVTSSSDFPTVSGSFSTTFTGTWDTFVTKISPDGSHKIYSTFLGTSNYAARPSIALDSSGDAYVTGYTTGTFPISAAYQSNFQGGYADAFVTKLNANGTGLVFSTYLGGNGDDEGRGIAVDGQGAAYVTGYTISSTFPISGAFQSTSGGGADAFVTKFNTDGGLVYSTYLGGNFNDYGNGIAVDTGGVAYITGETDSDGILTSTFPISGAFQSTSGGGADAFVTKLSATGALAYSSFLGSSFIDIGYGIAVDASGAAYITGATGDSVCFSCTPLAGGFSFFPTTSGAFQLCNAYIQVFVTKVAPSGNALTYSTCIGDLQQDEGFAIAVAPYGLAYITGYATDSDFPATFGAFQTSRSDQYYADAFVSILNSTGTDLEYSTFLGGANWDYGQGIAVTPNGVAYVTGGTWSTDFPLKGAFQISNTDNNAAFVTRFDLMPLLDQMTRGCACPVCCFLADRHHAGGPIDTQSGNYTYQKVDEHVPVLAGSLEFKHSYSADTSNLLTRTLGYGWTHSYDVHLVFPTDPGGVAGQVQLQGAGGSQFPFFDLGNGTYQPYSGVTAQMSRIMATGNITTYVVTATNQTIYTFNATGQVTQTVNPAGNVITYTYYPTAPLQSVQSYGRFLNFAYDTQNRLTRVTDPINRSTQFGYNANGDLAVMTDTRGLAWTYQYSGTTHLLTQIIDPDNRTVEQTIYDGQGRAIQQYNGLNQLTVQLTYGTLGTINVTDGLTRTSVDRYGRGLWLGGNDAAGQPLTKTYDINFKPTLLADQNGNSTQYTWSANGSNLQQVVDPAGHATALGYDMLNNLTQTVDTRGFTTTYTYSGTLLTRQTDVLGNTSVYTYGQSNLLVAQQDALGNITQYGYDGLGQRIAITDALGNVTRYGYDPVGRLITTTDAIGRIAINAYDNADHLIAATSNYTSTSSQQNYLNAYNLITRYGYDGFGRQVAVTDTLGHVTLNGYDGAGRLISTTTNFTTTSGAQNYLNQYNLINQSGYDAIGNQILVTDTLSHVTKTNYDNLNRPITVTTNYVNGIFDSTKPDEDIIRVTGYDPAGNPITQTDALGRITRTYYDSLNRVVSTTVNYSPTLSQNYLNQYNLITQYGFDAAGNQVLITDTLGHSTLNVYDPLNRLSSTTVNYSPSVGVNYLNQYNLITQYGYDNVGNRVVVTDPLTGTTRFAYDALNRVVTTTNTLSGTNVTVYDALGNRVQSIDALNHTTVYTYDVANRLLAQASPIPGEATTYQYDALGRTIAITDPLSHATRTFYDALGRVVSTTNALTGTTAYVYDALSRQTVITDANSHPALMAYDGLGRVITTTDALGNQTVVSYDGVGNRIKVTDGLTHTTVYTYDVLNRLVAQADPLGNVLQYGYDPLGNRSVLTDANGIVTRYGYDPLSRLITVTENYSTTGPSDSQTNLITQYGYDAVGNRTVITNARNFTTTYTYDPLYRLTALRDPLGNTTTYGYDTVGNRTVLTDANSHVTQYAYDAVNRPLVITYTADGKTVQYTYDLIGNRLAMTDSLGTTRYTYDALNRVTQVTDPFTGTVGYAYDSVGNRTQLIYPDGKVVTDTYDAANRLASVMDWAAQTTVYSYDAASRLVTTTLPDGIQTAYTYDTANRLTRLTHTRNNGSTLVGDYQYILDKVGNRIGVTETLLTPSSSGQSAMLLPTRADEVAAAVTGQRAPGLSALRAMTQTWSSAGMTPGTTQPATLGVPNLFAWMTNGALSDGGIEPIQFPRVDRTDSTAAASIGTASHLPALQFNSTDQSSSADSLVPPKDGDGIILSASRTNVNANGTDTVLIGVTVPDANQAAAVEGLSITWTTDLGRVIPISTTMQNGFALVQFVGGVTPGTAHLVAQVGDLQGSSELSVLPMPVMPGLVAGNDRASQVNQVLDESQTTLQIDTSGQPVVNAPAYDVTFNAAGLALNLTGAGNAPNTTRQTAQRAATVSVGSDFSYQLQAVDSGSTIILSSTLQPTISVQGDTVYYDHGAGVSEWYRSRVDGIEQGFTFQSLPPLSDDLTIVGVFSSTLRPQLDSQTDGITFYDSSSGLDLLNYGRVVVYDNAGQRTSGLLELQGNIILIHISKDWLAQAVYPVTVDPLLQQVQVASATAENLDVAYASSNQQYLLAWTDKRNATPDIYGRFTSVTGTVQGNSFAISTAAYTQASPSLAYASTPNQYLVVWQDRRNNSNFQVYGQRVSITGTLLGSSFAISTTGTDQIRPDVAYNSTTSEYLVAWRDGDVIDARRVLSDGTPTGTSVLVSNVNGQPPSGDVTGSPAIAYNPADQEYLVTWHDTRNDVLGDIYAQRMSITATLINTNTGVMTTSLREIYPAVAYNPTSQEYLVAATGGAYQYILAQRLNHTAQRAGTVITVTTATTTTAQFDRPAVTAENDSDYVVAWVDNFKTGLQRLSATGDFVGTAITVSTGSLPTVVAMDYSPQANSHLVAWRDGNTLYDSVYQPVEPGFSATPISGTAPLTVTFTNTSQPTSSLTSYLWNFGDGYTSSITNPVHGYTTTGYYTVTLTALAGSEQKTITQTNAVTVTSGGSLTTMAIAYTYDPLSRLTSAVYSGTYTYTFAYAYDAVGDRTAQTATITSTLVTTYTYDATDRLQTSKVNSDPTIWYYAYDANGNLHEMTPNGNSPANGAIRYTYDSANHLNKVEMHNGTSYNTLAQMAYDGMGNRAQLTTWAGGLPLTTTYANSPDSRILQATTGATNTTYLYGVGAIGEFGSQASYYLVDGTGSMRQVVDQNASVTLARWYDPFGQIIKQDGTGDALYGYLGTQFDKVIGLMYIDGRYYDPVTGRFLTPSGNSEQSPYVPLAGAALAPLIIVAVLSRKKKGQIWTGWLVLAVMASVGLGLVACGGGPTPTPTPTQPPTVPPSPSPSPTPNHWNIGSCYGDAFCEQYGQQIADRAGELIQAFKSGSISIESTGTGYVGKDYIPYRQQRTGQPILYVCADVARDAYGAAGIDLQQAMITLEPGWINPDVPKDAISRNTTFLQFYLQRAGVVKAGDEFPYTAGEIILLGGWENENAKHAGVVVTGGMTVDEVIIAQASYGDMRIDYYPLREFVKRFYTTYTNAYHLPFDSTLTPEQQAKKVAIHGHPTIEEVKRVLSLPR